jgi:hypothetical protein
MSLNLVRAVDPRTDVNSHYRKTYSVYDGAQDVGYIRTKPDGGVSSSSLSFTANPPSPQVFVNRRAMVEMEFEIVFQGVSAGAGIPLLQVAGAKSTTGANVGNQFHDAPRAFPIQNALTNIEISLNNDRITQNLNQYIRAFPRYQTCAKSQDINYGLSPSMLDQAQDYAELDGFARDPLRGYGDNPLQVPRGGFVGIDVLQNTSTGVNDTAVVRLKCTEYLMVSPMLFEQDDQDTGFIGIQTMKLILSLGGRGNGALAGLAGSLWSHSSSGGSVLNSAVASVVDAQTIFSYLTPDPTMQIPKTNFYSYYQPQVFPTTTFAPVNPQASTTIQMNNIQLDAIPNRLFLFVDEVDSAHDLTKSDTYFGIENVAISFDNRDNLLANATEQDLYNIAVKNGTNLSWTQWTRDCGAVLALDFAADIPLRTLQAVGMRGSYNLRITIKTKNLSSVAKVPTLTCVVISEGVMVIDHQQVSRNIGVLDQQDVLESKYMPEVVYHASGSIYGGNFWQRVLNFGKKAVAGIKKYARPAIDAAEKIADVAGIPQLSMGVAKADQLARQFGLGMHGRGLTGGKSLSRAQLQRMLKE